MSYDQSLADAERKIATLTAQLDETRAYLASRPTTLEFQEVTAECDQLRKALEAIEWAGHTVMSGQCPECDGYQTEGHTRDCIVGLAMGKCGPAEASPR